MPDTLTFCMLTPDGVLAQQRDPLLQALEAAGFTVQGTRLLQLDYLQLGRMYAHSEFPPVGSGQSFELPEAVMSPLYLLAPACVFVLRRPAGEAADAIMAVKGATIPAEAEPGTIRSRGEHALFNFLHCPDDYEGAVLELAYLVGEADAQGLRQAAPHTGVASLLEAWPAFEGPTALSFPHVARRLRWRVVMKLASLGCDVEAAVTSLRTERLSDGPAADRLRLAREAHPAIHHALLQAAAGHPGFLSGLEALGELYLPEGRRRLTPIVRLRHGGIYLSELERVALEGYRQAHWSSHAPWDFRL